MTNTTAILDYNHPKVRQIVKSLTESLKDEKEIVKACYLYVRDTIKFGYNESDDIPASKVIEDGYGQCNTKSNLLLALLRASNIEARFHGFTIDKRLQYGAVTGIFYLMTPKEILHSWIEVKIDGEWLNLEGFILDSTYLNSLKKYFSKETKSLCGYGVASDSFGAPEIEYEGNNSTYIQKEGIVRDLGVFSTPDEFYEKYGTNPQGIRKILFKYLVRKIMNSNISRIRKQKSKGNLRTLCSVEDVDTLQL